MFSYTTIYKEDNLQYKHEDNFIVILSRVFRVCASSALLLRNEQNEQDPSQNGKKQKEHVFTKRTLNIYQLHAVWSAFFSIPFS